MKVLHVISSIDTRAGGPIVALQGLALAQKKAGLKVVIAATYPAGSSMVVADTLQKAGVEVNLIGPVKGKLGLHPDMGRIVRKLVGASEIVHIHALWEQIQHRAARTARQAQIPYIFRPCGMLDPWSLSQSRWIKRLFLAMRLRRDLDHAALLHFTATAERDRTQSLKLKANSVVIPNGIDLGEFAELPSRGVFRDRFGINESSRIVLSLSRLHYKKGLDYLIPAFAQAALPDSILVLAGPDSDHYAATLQELADRHGIADRVLFTGMLRGRERIEAFVDADLFVLPSRQENFGIAVVEALAAGTPVVISDQVNIHDEIISAAVGGVVPLDIPTLAQSIHRWMSDVNLRSAAAAKSREFAMTHYSWDKIAVRWSDIYNDIVAAASPQT